MDRLFVRHLTVIDSSYLDPVRGLVGMSWIADLELAGSLDEQGMVLDFGEIKSGLRAGMEQAFDHKLLIPAACPGVERTTSGGRTEVRIRLNDGGLIRCQGPADAFCAIEAPRITDEALTAAVAMHLQGLVPANVQELRLTLRPEAIDGACFHYSHGLRHHRGNCQRIAHGHRSRIEIERNGVRDPALEQATAAWLDDGYLGSREDLIGETTHDGRPTLCFAYDAPQGRFELDLPAARCHLFDTETTVENIARLLAARLKADHPADRIRVRAFEGVDKGAIALA